MAERTQARFARRLLLTIAVGAWLGAVASPAAAQQRDPFDPIVSTGAADDTGTTTSGSTEAQADPSSAPAPSTNSAVEETTLPNTGAGISQWIGVAYVLVAIGVSLLILGKVAGERPARIAREKGARARS